MITNKPNEKLCPFKLSTSFQTRNCEGPRCMAYIELIRKEAGHDKPVTSGTCGMIRHA